MPQPSFTLKSLTLRAFRSVVEEQSVALPATGMHLILGPSGAGKSTLAEGIAFGLGFGTISATALQSWDWLTQETLLDIVEVETPKGLLRVKRGKNASILMPGEEKARTSAKAVAEGVVQALGLKPEFLEALTYRAQKTPGKFLSMKDSEKKSFLTALLGLEKFEAAAEKSVQAVSALQAEAERARVRWDTLKSTLPPLPPEPFFIDPDALKVQVRVCEDEVAKVQAMLDEMKALDIEVSTRQVRQVEATRKEWQPKVDEARLAVESVPPADIFLHAVRLGQIADEQAKFVKAHRAEVALVQKELDTTRDLYRGLKVLADRKTAAEQTLAQAEKDLEVLKEQKCFTCGQEWNQNINAWVAKTAERDVAKKTVHDAEVSEQQLPLLEAAGKDLKVKLADIQAKDPVPRSLVEEEQKLRAERAAAKAERETKVANLRAAASKVSADMERAIQAVSRMTTEEEQVRRALGDLHVAVAAANSKLASARQAVMNADRENQNAARMHAQALSQYTRAVEAMAAAENTAKNLQVSVATEQDFLGMVRGFLSYIFDETLARIADRTNARLALIPNVADLTLRFSSERETGTGKLRQEITAVCEKNGHVIPIRDGTSGGMYTAVELAVDLSVADVIAERTGVYPGWLFLDECFEGLDTPCKTACFDMLKAISAERAIFVVDHMNEFKELFDSRIQVEFDGARSRFAVLQ